MILQKLTLANFRQFKGIQQIDFSHRTKSDGKDVTVIFGENGRGKTSIFRAIMFCLFGERRLSQDGDIDTSELQLVNVTALEHSNNKPVETYVELDFSHKERNYNLRRAIWGMRKGDKTIEELGEVKLVETLPSGNSKQIDPADIDGVIGSILDRRVKDYFLFDGEKIERLTRASIEQRREIGKGIRNLLNVDSLETARKATDRLTKEIEEELRENSSPELAKLLKRLSDNEQAQEVKKKRLDEICEEEVKAQSEKADVDKKLEAFKEIRDLIEKRKGLEQRLQDLEQKAKDHLSGMKDHTAKAASLLVAEAVVNVFKHIERQKQRGEIPSEIRKDLIERILDAKRCICGNEVCEGTVAHERILEWLNRTSDATIQDAALNLWRYLSDVQGHFEDDTSNIENRLLIYGNIKNEVEEYKRRLEHLREEIGTSERQDASKLDNYRKKLEEKLVKLEAENQSIKSRISELEREYEQLVAQLKEEKRKQGLQDELSRRATLARDTRDALHAVYDKFTSEIKNIIGERATKLFRELLDSEGRENLREIVVNNDYSLQVLDRRHKPFLANISAGQRQIMSISFIAALAQAASNDTLLEMPLFMDTPFGRLSYEHRKNLIRSVPEFSSQWILLATDTEFRKQEAKLLQEGNRWGKFFMLRPTEDGNTKIEERKVDSAQSILKDEVDTR